MQTDGMTVTTVDPSKRHRRPTGAPPPLPRHIPWTTRLWVVVLIALIALSFVARRWSALEQAIDQVDAAILRAIASVRTSALTTAADAVNSVVRGWTMFAIGAGLLVALIVLRRWQHLFAFLGSVLVVEVIGLFLIDRFERPRPFDVTTIGDWDGFAFPSAPAVIVSFTVVGLIFGLVVAGRPRVIAKVVGAVVIGVVIAARLYLATDHPTDVLVGVVLGTAIPLLAFRFFAPNESFPVSYRQRKAAHLDIDDRRAEAIRSGGVRPTRPARRRHGTDRPGRLRWFHAAAAAPGRRHGGVRQALRQERTSAPTAGTRRSERSCMGDSRTRRRSSRCVGWPSRRTTRCASCATPVSRRAAPLGVVELTPEREYLVVTEFFEGSREITDAEVDDDVIDQGWRSCGGCGMPGSPTATSSPPTCSCVTGSCC